MVPIEKVKQFMELARAYNYSSKNPIKLQLQPKYTDSEFVKILMEISNSIHMFFINLDSFEEDIKSLGRFHYLKSAKNTLESSFNSLYNCFIYQNIHIKYISAIANKINCDISEEINLIKENEALILEKFKQFEQYIDLNSKIESIINIENIEINSKNIDSPEIKKLIKNIKNEIDNSGLSKEQIFSIYNASTNLKNDIHQNYEQFKINDIYQKCYQKIRNKNINYLSSMAHKYEYMLKNENTDNKIFDFLFKKQFENSIQLDIELNSNCEYKKYIVFEDLTVLAFDKKDNLKIFENILDVENIFLEDLLKFSLRKNPSLYKFVKQKIDDDGLKNNIPLSVFLMCNNLLTNSNILKNEKFDINYLKNMSFEYADDKINSIVRNDKIKSFAYSIVSKKYEHLINNESLKIFEEFYDLEMSKKSLQNLIGVKIAAFKTSEDFNNFLNNVFDNLSEFKEDKLIEKLGLFNITPVYNKDNIYVIEVKDYYISKAFGSPQWCIVREESYFNDYANNNRQYFLFDFNRNEKDEKSMIGFTLYNNGEFYTQHMKNDNYIEVDSDLSSIRDHIVFFDKENYELSEEKLESLSQVFEIKKTSLKQELKC